MPLHLQHYDLLLPELSCILPIPNLNDNCLTSNRLTFTVKRGRQLITTTNQLKLIKNCKKGFSGKDQLSRSRVDLTQAVSKAYELLNGDD